MGKRYLIQGRTHQGIHLLAKSKVWRQGSEGITVFWLYMMVYIWYNDGIWWYIWWFIIYDGAHIFEYDGIINGIINGHLNRIPGLIYLAIFWENCSSEIGPSCGTSPRSCQLWVEKLVLLEESDCKRLGIPYFQIFSEGNPCRFPSSGLAVAVGVHVARAMMFLSVSTGKFSGNVATPAGQQAQVDMWKRNSGCNKPTLSWDQKNDMLNVFRVFQGWCPNTTQVPVFEFLWCRDSTPKNSWYTLSTQAKRETNMTKVRPYLKDKWSMGFSGS